MYFTYAASPLGSFLLAGDGTSITLASFPDGPKRRLPQPGWIEDQARLRCASQQVEEYFSGKRKSFDLPLDPTGTPFQQSVWRYLVGIPYGTTFTYGQVAAQLDKPTACRAVGAANGANPLPLLIPCHRLLGAKGQLTGFGGGLAAKRWLIDFEKGAEQPSRST